MEDVFEQITKEELTQDLDMIAELCGLDTVKKLLRHFGGISFYIPKLTRLDKFVFKYIKTNNDKTYKLIAKELGVSEHYLRLVRKRHIRK